METIAIDVWSDIACPWCWVGKRHLEAALEEIDQPVELTWHAFELDPSAPKVPDRDVDYVARLGKKYGVGTAEAQGMIDRMTKVGASVGLDFRFDRVTPTNTFDAHRLLHWAHGEGVQDALKERLFCAYMSEGANVGDPATLVALAKEVGLDEARAEAILAGDEYRDAVRADERAAQQMGVRGVPCFVLGGRYAVSGAQPPNVLVEALRELGREKTANDAEVCGPDGCAVPSD